VEYRQLGKTELQISVVGLGTEYLNHRSRRAVVEVVHEALDSGINYLDIVFAFGEYRDNLGAALRGCRDRMVVAGHICTGEVNGHYQMTRDVEENKVRFHDLLSRLGTDHVDIVVVQMVNSQEGYAEVTRPGGVMDLARRLREEGKTRFIGMSGHRPAAALQAMQSGLVDVFMYPINLAWDLAPGRKEVAQAAAQHQVGLLAMKPFAGGRLLQRKEGRQLSPVQCIHYVVSQPGVCAAVTGVKNISQLQAAARYAAACAEERSYAALVAEFREEAEGNCVYCNHCMPCPAGIDIGRTLESLDRALTADAASRKRLRDQVSLYYPARIRTARAELHSALASDCLECGECVERCPFGVDIVARMRQAAQVLG
jgi:predicted aldo/keto reductase-like oxidoreductase